MSWLVLRSKDYVGAWHRGYQVEFTSGSRHLDVYTYPNNQSLFHRYTNPRSHIVHIDCSSSRQQTVWFSARHRLVHIPFKNGSCWVCPRTRRPSLMCVLDTRLIHAFSLSWKAGSVVSSLSCYHHLWAQAPRRISRWNYEFVLERSGVYIREFHKRHSRAVFPEAVVTTILIP